MLFARALGFWIRLQTSKSHKVGCDSSEGQLQKMMGWLGWLTNGWITIPRVQVGGVLGGSSVVCHRALSSDWSTCLLIMIVKAHLLNRQVTGPGQKVNRQERKRSNRVNKVLKHISASQRWKQHIAVAVLSWKHLSNQEGERLTDGILNVVWSGNFRRSYYSRFLQTLLLIPPTIRNTFYTVIH